MSASTKSVRAALFAAVECTDAVQKEIEELKAICLEMQNALFAIVKNPHGCVFCDCGTLRVPNKGHEDDCPYTIAERAIYNSIRQNHEPIIRKDAI